MSDRETLKRFEDWLIDEIDSLSGLPGCRQSFHEAKYILWSFREIRDDAGREENHEESIESGS